MREVNFQKCKCIYYIILAEKENPADTAWSIPYSLAGSREGQVWLLSGRLSGGLPQGFIYHPTQF